MSHGESSFDYKILTCVFFFFDIRRKKIKWINFYDEWNYRINEVRSSDLGQAGSVERSQVIISNFLYKLTTE